MKDNKPLFIIAEDIEGEALATTVLNIICGTLRVCAVKVPGFGDERKEMLEDIAAVTGGKVISEEKGMKLENTTLDDLASARKVNKEKTIIIEGQGKKENIDRRVAILEGQIKLKDSEYKEKKMRIDDVLNATKAAIEEPLKLITTNAGKEGSVVVEHLKPETNPNIGYDAKTDRYKDMIEADIIDPVKVLRSALQNAASIASLVLTTEALVSDIPEEKARMPGMGPESYMGM